MRTQNQYDSIRLQSALIVVAMAFGIGPSLVSAKVIYVGQQQVSESLPTTEVNHAVWDDLLQKYVDDRGMVDYAAWKSNKIDMRSLDEYLHHLSSAQVLPQTSTNRNAQLAFWINAYNAVTVHGILREYPTESIKDHVSRFGGYSIWKHYQLYVDGKPYSLDDIEHKVLRKMNEPRIHFAVVCASISCPRLLNAAFQPDLLEDQLNENARDFFSQPGNFRYDSGKKRFYVSSILKWYGADFAPTPITVMKKLAKYLPDAVSQQAAKAGEARVSFQKYDWGLNEQSR